MDFSSSKLGNAAPHGQASVSNFGSDDSHWLQLFGMPNEAMKQTPYSNLSRENYDLPEAFKGPLVYLDMMLIYIIKLSQMYVITQLLPLKMMEGANEIVWSVWKFNAAQLGRRPEESMSRLVTTKFEQGRTSLVSWGLAFLAEHGFWNTVRGQMQYRYSLIQIANATIETLCYGGCVALLSARPKASSKVNN